MARHSPHHAPLALLLASLVLTGCGAPTRGPGALRHPTRENCLVLSTGGPAGVAHLGAIEALREARVPIRCVVGSSMGAVVGALYAVDPAGDTTARFERFRDEYVRVTTAEVRQAGESVDGHWDPLFFDHDGRPGMPLASAASFL